MNISIKCLKRIFSDLLTYISYVVSGSRCNELNANNKRYVSEQSFKHDALHTKNIAVFQAI